MSVVVPNSGSNNPPGDDPDPNQPPKDKNGISSCPNMNAVHNNLLRYIIDFIRYVFQTYGIQWEPDPRWEIPDLSNTYILFRPDMADAIIRYRNGIDDTFRKRILQYDRNLLLDREKRQYLEDYIKHFIHECFTKYFQGHAMMGFLFYSAFVVDLSVYLHRYNGLFRMDMVILSIIYMFERHIRQTFMDEFNFFFAFNDYVEAEHLMFLRPDDFLQRNNSNRDSPPPPEDILEPRPPNPGPSQDPEV